MDSTYFLAGGIHEWDKSSMKEVILPTGAHVNVVKDPSNGTFYAIDNVCAHKKASLCLGDIEDLASHSAEGLCVRCPKHRGKFCGGLYFDLHTGLKFDCCCDNERKSSNKSPNTKLGPNLETGNLWCESARRQSVCAHRTIQWCGAPKSQRKTHSLRSFGTQKDKALQSQLQHL